MGISCDFVAKGDSPDVAARKLLNHITHQHKKQFEELSAEHSEEELRAMIKEKVVANGVSQQ